MLDLNLICKMACLNCKMIHGEQNTKVTKAIRPLQDIDLIDKEDLKAELLFQSDKHHCIGDQGDNNYVIIILLIITSSYISRSTGEM